MYKASKLGCQLDLNKTILEGPSYFLFFKSLLYEKEQASLLSVWTHFPCGYISPRMCENRS